MRLLIVILCLLPFSHVRHIDVCELNRLIDCNGKETVAYWLYRDWNREVSEFTVQDWRGADAIPWPEHGRQSWYDAKTKRTITVECGQVVEVWSTFDLESDERKRWPESRRRKL